ncbi:15563_t:CDS:2 [Entrophospora sp. SA101]|nr:7712_t:CDS:2 [Entrophospora sp. SA101]CAJ0752558.1 15563_t:CDS:2 [Entrophospora sp. SA101]
MKGILEGQRDKSPAHLRLYEGLCAVNVNDLSWNDPLVNNIIDLGSSQFSLEREEQSLLVGERASIRGLNKEASIRKLCTNFVVKRNEIQQRYRFMIMPSEKVTHGRWVEQDYERDQVGKNITDLLLLKIRSNVLRRVSDGGERQSIASKNQKVLEEISSRGDRPDLMIRASLKRKQNEIVYIESGKWASTDQKIRDDHNKLARLCSHGYNEIVKGKRLRKVYIAFGINIAGSNFILSGLIQEESIKYYMPIIKAKIPFHDESVEEPYIEISEKIIQLIPNAITEFAPRDIKYRGRESLSSHMKFQTPRSEFHQRLRKNDFSP